MSAALKLALISEGMATTWPVYVAQGLRLFEREGIAVEVTLTGASAGQLAALAAGEYDIGFQQADHIVRAVERGQDLFVFMSTARAPELTLVATPDVAAIEQLRGRAIAVDGARSGYALLLRRLLAARGLAGADCRFDEIGGSQERFEAMRDRRAAASLLNSPFDRRLLAAGCNSLGTTAEFFPGYPGPIAATRRSWAAAHRTELIAFIRAMRAACDWLREPQHRDEAIALLPQRLGASRELAEEAYARFALHPVPEITDEGLREVVSVVWDAERLPGARGDPARYADTSFLRAACAR